MIPIDHLHLHRMKMTMKNPFKTSFGTLQEKEFFIIEAIDQDGNHGYGESVAFASPWYTEETVETNLHMMRDFLIPLIKSIHITHPDDVLQIFQPIRGNNMAKAAIEGAIWDLYAKQQGIPLAEALDGTKKTIDVGISIGMQPTHEALLEVIEARLKDGYKRIKLKIEPGNDLSLLREVRHHFPHVPLMADANSAYTLKDVNHLKQLDDLNLLMIEQPLGYNDIVDHAILQQSMKTPICLDESIHSFQDVRQAIHLGSCQIINIKIGRVGGLTEAKRIHDYCQQKGIAVWCGGMLEAGVGRAHNIAITALPHFTLPGDTAGSANYWEKDIIHPEVIVEEGVIQVPNRPGIGYDVDQTTLQQYTTEVITINF